LAAAAQFAEWQIQSGHTSGRPPAQLTQLGSASTEGLAISPIQNQRAICATSQLTRENKQALQRCQLERVGPQRSRPALTLPISLELQGQPTSGHIGTQPTRQLDLLAMGPHCTAAGEAEFQTGRQQVDYGWINQAQPQVQARRLSACGMTPKHPILTLGVAPQLSAHTSQAYMHHWQPLAQAG
jgi:hypothetical protein